MSHLDVALRHKVTYTTNHSERDDVNVLSIWSCPVYDIFTKVTGEIQVVVQEVMCWGTNIIINMCGSQSLFLPQLHHQLIMAMVLPKRVM